LIIEGLLDAPTSGDVAYNDEEDDPHGVGRPHTLQGEVIAHRYMVLPRDKARTYAIIARVPKAANIQRSEFLPIPLRNVAIDNNDFQLVQRVMERVCSRGGGLQGEDHDIVYYQMLFQVSRRSKPSDLKAPRTIIMTKSLLLLCRERLTSSDIAIDVVDQAALSDVQKIIVGDKDSSPLHVTLVLRPTSVFAASRKWRLYADSSIACRRLQEECRRCCAAAGATV